MSDLMQIALLIGSAVYFWTVMFERFTRPCAALAGVILIGTSGTVLLPDQEHVFETIAFGGLAALLFARSWLIWKEWLGLRDEGKGKDAL